MPTDPPFVPAGSNSSSPEETLADGRYGVWRKIASGSQADTLEAVDRRDGKAVAIKRFKVSQAKSWKDVELAEREARVLASLSHPALPAYVDHFEEHGALYLVMERVEGENLAEFTRAGKRLGRSELRALLGTLSEILEYLHSRVPPVIHRDIKPGNIILRPDGTFALVDFGTVRDGLRPDGGSTVVGTFGYMAPEQFQGRAMPATDVYAVGALMLALLSGKGPDELPHRGLAIDVAASVGNAVPPHWLEALTRMVDINPDVRPSSLAPMLALFDGHASSTETERATSAPRSNTADSDDSEHEPDASFTVMVGSGFALIPLILLSAARLALWVALGVVVPTVLRILALFFGRALQHAALRVSEAGRLSREQLAVLSRHLERAEPFVLQGQHYRRRRYDKRSWRNARKAWRADANYWKKRVRSELRGAWDDAIDQDYGANTAEQHRRESPRTGSIFSDDKGLPRDGNTKK